MGPSRTHVVPRLGRGELSDHVTTDGNVQRGSRPLSPADLRDELKRAIRRRGITVVAAETGTAHQTLRAFLAGSRVTSATSAKLLGWYARHAESALVGAAPGPAATDMVPRGA